MRGERLSEMVRALQGIGSSPHARGTRPQVHHVGKGPRFIPACAGNAVAGSVSNRVATVHPRMRGERIAIHRSIYLSIGSSPHARGTLDINELDRIRYRFIPACAGNAADALHGLGLCPVHPRMRGERFVHSSAMTNFDGSSPHARGTLVDFCQHGPHIRFIPACAGNATGCPACGPCVAVHPRMRGERMEARGVTPLPCGSSPHARGTPSRHGFALTRMRFIPACAGNAVVSIREQVGPAVHPRMRGERMPRRTGRLRVSGSSPHARGTPTWKPIPSSSKRFIPACAGNAR